MQRSKIYLPDVNVCLAFAAGGHMHHPAAVRWMEGIGNQEAAFCRVTQMGLLRLLTNTKVMRQSTLSQSQLQKDERTLFLTQPDGIQDRWRQLTARSSPSLHLWTDSYLYAFADLRDCGS